MPDADAAGPEDSDSEDGPLGSDDVESDRVGLLAVPSGLGST